MSSFPEERVGQYKDVRPINRVRIHGVKKRNKHKGESDVVIVEVKGVM
jgi:hypothetical protein